MIAVEHKTYQEYLGAATDQALALMRSGMGTDNFPEVYLWVGPVGVGGLIAAVEAPGAGYDRISSRLPLGVSFPDYRRWVDKFAKSAPIFR